MIEDRSHEIEINDGMDDDIGEHCPNCPDIGYYYEPDDKTGEPIPVQCEFCYTNKNSIFNLTTKEGGADE